MPTQPPRQFVTCNGFLFEVAVDYWRQFLEEVSDKNNPDAVVSINRIIHNEKFVKIGEHPYDLTHINPLTARVMLARMPPV
jgi:hypothetical protein